MDQGASTALGHGVSSLPPLPRPAFAPTRREREVLALPCQLLTDPEIAEHVLINQRTINNHVTHIFDKLGVHSRRETAAVVAHQCFT